MTVLDNLAPAVDAEPEPTTTPADDARRRRWRVAAHEGGHLVAVLAGGFSADTAVVLPGGGGWAVFYRRAPRTRRRMTRFESAVIAAAGPVGEQLAETHDVPQAPRPVLRGSLEIVAAEARAVLDAQEQSAGPDIDDCELDLETVARHATATADWAAWSDRAAYVHERAGMLLCEHSDLHRALSVALFHRGFMDADEIENVARVHAPELFMEADEL